jgi:hypothetical protein
LLLSVCSHYDPGCIPDTGNCYMRGQSKINVVDKFRLDMWRGHVVNYSNGKLRVLKFIFRLIFI